MDMKKIGSFLKILRKEKGLTQEQLAEKLGVAGRTVSRWETASNMPDFSILIQLADFYDVQIDEILDGERKNQSTTNGLKETLTKVANYNEAEKIRKLKIANCSYLLTLFVCFISLLLQLIFIRNLQTIIGEYITLMVGGISYSVITVKNGLWHNSSNIIKDAKYDFKISVIMSIIFTVICSALVYIEVGKIDTVIVFAVIFFVAITVTNFSVLRILAKISKRNEDNKKK